MKEQKNYNYAIIGGGVYGLSIAFHLAKTQQQIIIFERSTIGHNNGSSHGPQRITRNVYQHEFYRDMNTLALKQYWPQAEKALNTKIIYPNQFIWFQQSKQQYERLAQVAKNGQNKIQFLTAEQICQKFTSMPFIKFQNKGIVDYNAGMIAAEEYISKLYQYLKKLDNVTILQNTSVQKLSKQQKKVIITTQSSTFSVGKIVVSSGRWIGGLIPQIKDLFHAQKRHIAYCKLQNPEKYQFGKIPSLYYACSDYLYYTTPDRKGLGFKIGTTILRKQPCSQETAQKQQRQLQIKIGQQLFGEKFLGVSQFDTCYYTYTKSKEFLIDWADQDEKILVCSCCSGHGFKFSVLIGKIVTDLLVNNKSIDIFEKYRYSCKIKHHQQIENWKI